MDITEISKKKFREIKTLMMKKKVVLNEKLGAIKETELELGGKL